MKNIIIDLLYKLIQFVETIEYRSLKLDQNDISSKLLYSQDISDLELYTESDKGLVPISHFHITQPYDHYKVTLGNGYELTCADNHIVFTEDLQQIFVKDLKLGDILYTDNGPSKVFSVERINRCTSMGDLTIDTDDHRYYTNGILSHNTISSAIYILHYLLFNNDKNVLIAANIGDTAVEIIDKIKHIYEGLPFFLQAGIVTWNQKTIKFDNGCRMKGFAMTKTSSIGQTADFVYVDEFAYIPETIAQAFYKSIQPTLVSIDNSKMIITSTPDGLNLFHKLFTESQYEPGDPRKNNFAGMTVYWHQVPGRNVNYIRMNPFLMVEHGIDEKDVWDYCKGTYDPYNEKDINNIPYIQKKKNRANNYPEIHLLNRENVTDLDILKNLRFKNNNDDMIPIGAFAELSSWKLDAIKNIGSEEAFNQEYDLRFVNASKSLFSESTMERIQNGEKDFKYEPHDVFDKLNWDYSKLKFIQDKDIFDITNRKKEYCIISVDVSEGLGGDYSVINIFKISEKSTETIEMFKDGFKTFDDFYCLKQIGVFRDNLVSVEQLAEILYLLAFDFFNEEQVKIVLEINNHGHAVKEAIKHVFKGENDYATYIFYKFKHRADDPKKSIGLKVGRNKNIFVRSYQDKMKDRSIEVHEKKTITEIGTFIKHEKSNGSVMYKGDGTANDDIVMTIVNMSNVFEDNIYKNLVEEYMMNNSNNSFRSNMDIILKNISENSNSGTDYTGFLKAANRSLSNNRYLRGNGNGSGGWTNQIR